MKTTTHSLPSGSYAKVFGTGQGFRVCIVDRQGDILFKHFAHLKHKDQAEALAKKIQGSIDYRFWFDGTGNKLIGTRATWEFAPRGELTP